ncbi:hypothetical protein [Hymenobacter sp. APR13]|uniref:hypothetical protein n=1 Tax=Hymenobacter sp. APR13 TaxID=1356852 RepID=UPI0012E030B1|nr:hypothetical protein [Hymenobacter sp. APR13]
MATKTKLLVLATLTFLALAFYLLAGLLITSSTPSIIDETIEASKADRKLNSLIGTYRGFQAEFDENDTERDTINFTILHKGSRKNILIKYKAKSTYKGKWKLINSDTISITDK